MADKKANLIIQLKDEVSAGLQKLGGGVDSLKAKFQDWKNAIAVASAALTATAAAAYSAIKAYLESETAVNKLNRAMVNQGVYTREASRDMQEFAASLQRTTTYSDEAVVGVITMLTQFGLTGEAAKKATKTVLDLSTGLGVDLNSAAMLVGKAFQGSTESLGRYGIKVDENIPKAQKFDAVMSVLNDRFGGQAQAALNTTAGQMANFSERIGEVKEIIGKALLPILQFFIEKLLVLLQATEQIANSTSAWRRFAATVGGVLVELGRMVFDVFITPFRAISPLLDKIGIDATGMMRSADNAFNSLSARLEQWAVAHEDKANRVVAATALEEQMEAESAARRLALLNQDMVNRQTVETAALAKKVAEKKKADAATAKSDADTHATLLAQTQKHAKDTMAELTALQKFESYINSERGKNFTTTLNSIATLATAKNKQLVAIGKAAAITQATIDTYTGVGRALASAPPPFNFALAALVATAGFANVARISGVPLAEGGVVMPRSGGTLATIGEAGRPEAVIPLGDKRAQEQLSGLGPTFNVSIQAGAFVGDRASVKEFALMLDEELFKLYRNNLGVSA